MDDKQWYDQMAAAMKRREKCKGMIDRWQIKLEEVEKEISSLRSGEAVASAEQEPAAEVAPSPDGAVPAVEWKAAETAPEAE